MVLAENDLEMTVLMGSSAQKGVKWHTRPKKKYVKVLVEKHYF